VALRYALRGYIINRKACRYQKGDSSTVNQKTDNTMAIRKRTKRQTLIDKILHRKLKIQQLLKTKLNSFGPDG
jgi:hypothetical protein